MIGEIAHGKAEDILPTIPSESVGLVFTSPPYNVRAAGGFGSPKSTWKRAMFHEAGYDGHDDCMSHDDYVDWQRVVINELMRIISDDGAIFYNHKFLFRDKRMVWHHDILKDLPIRQMIVWDREVKYNFAPQYFAPQYEVIYVIAKDDWKPAKGFAARGDVWRIMPELSTAHPAPFPLKLARRVVAWNTAETVLDPFMGSGTTAMAAEMEKRQWIGIEKSAAYIEMAQVRLDELRRQKTFDF